MVFSLTWAANPAFAQIIKTIEKIDAPLIVKPELLPLKPEPAGTSETVTIPADKIQKIQDAMKAAEKRPESRVPSSIESFITEYWVQFLALVVSLIGVSLAVTGFTLAGAKKKKSVSKFLNQIDDTFAAFKWKSKRCEAELYRLHDLVDEQLKAGKIDEGSYQLLMHRIDKYLAEIREIDNLPPHLREKT